MFTLPAISGNSRYCSDSSGIMPLNALNGSSFMYSDETTTVSRPPSYEEAISSHSMFGLFIVNSGDSSHNSAAVSQQHQQHPQPHLHQEHDQPPTYQDLELLSHRSPDTARDKASSFNPLHSSRDVGSAEHLDTSIDNQLSQISIVHGTSSLTLNSPMPSPRPHSRKHESKMADKGKAKTGGTSGWKKHLSSEKSALSVAKDRLYRVLSPALSRKSGSGKVQLCSPRGQESEEEEPTTHPVRMCKPSARHRGGGGDHFDDIRAPGKPPKGKHHRHKRGADGGHK